MATAPFSIATTSPAASDPMTQWPTQEHTFRDVVKSWFETFSDPSTGLLLSTLTPTFAGLTLSGDFSLIGDFTQGGGSFTWSTDGDDDFIAQDTSNSTATNYIWGDASAQKLFLGAGTDYVTTLRSNLLPDNTETIGTSGTRWSNGYFTNLNVSGTLTLATLSLSGTATVNRLGLGTGSVSAPDIYWPNADANTGFYNDGGAPGIGVTINGTHSANFAEAGFVVSEDTTGLISPGAAEYGFSAAYAGETTIAKNNGTPLNVKRGGTDGNLIAWYKNTTNVASIAVNSGVVSYNTFMGAHWSQWDGGLPPAFVPRGTVLETVDKMASWPGTEEPEILPRVRIAGAASRAVYGVFHAYDEDGDIMVASLGAYVVRLAEGTVVQRGDLLESAGDGTARVQADDIVRASTLGKVTSSRPVDRHSDGSFTVPAVLYAG